MAHAQRTDYLVACAAILFACAAVVLSSGCAEGNVDGPGGGQVVDVTGDTGEVLGTPCKAAEECPGFDNPCLTVTCQADLCQVKELDDGTGCDDGDLCTANTLCKAGACVGDLTCQCKTTEDCAAVDDADLCNGSLYCAAGKCLVNPATVVTCTSAKDNACSKNTCDPDTGNCIRSPTNGRF